ISPSSISDAERITVELIPDSPATKTMRYTVDGTSPTIDSAEYDTPLKFTKSTIFRARSFGENGRPSQVSEQEFTVDPHLIPLDPKLWVAEDHAKASPAGAWKIDAGVIEQTSNVMTGGKQTTENTPNVERPGSLFTLEGDQEFGDGEVIFEIRSIDNDALGFVFGHESADKHYLWSMSAERPYRALALKNGDEYTVLESRREGYDVKAWHEVRLVFKESNVTCFFDGQKDFTVENIDLTGEGTIGFYSWGNSGSYFKNPRFVPDSKN
ncbi:MAG: hypothetical protein HKN23_13505, partial [Verrucomicrobiales bacterium]|nr:hypothetical protein [Verrucomicrobiales bacterium]